MKKKVLATLFVAASVVAAFAGCGSNSASGDKTITVAASPTPHAEILEQAKEILAKDGWTLEIIEFEDYVQPNEVVYSGEID